MSLPAQVSASAAMALGAQVKKGWHPPPPSDPLLPPSTHLQPHCLQMEGLLLSMGFFMQALTPPLSPLLPLASAMSTSDEIASSIAAAHSCSRILAFLQITIGCVLPLILYLWNEGASAHKFIGSNSQVPAWPLPAGQPTWPPTPPPNGPPAWPLAHLHPCLSGRLPDIAIPSMLSYAGAPECWLGAALPGVGGQAAGEPTTSRGFCFAALCIAS